MAEKDSKRIAHHLGLDTIHVSEIDTQVMKNIPENCKTFINTWSVIGLLEEGCEPAQAGWGTHEKTVPSDAEVIGTNQLAFNCPAYKKFHLSYLPDEEYVGVIIPHGEAVTIT